MVKFDVAAKPIFMCESRERIVRSAAAHGEIFRSVFIGFSVVLFAGQQPNQTRIWQSKKVCVSCLVFFRRCEETFFKCGNFASLGLKLLQNVFATLCLSCDRKCA